jgi:hypothetical protein
MSRRHPTTRRTSRTLPREAQERAARARADYERTRELYKDAPAREPWGGTPFDYVTFHKLWNRLCSTIPRTDLGQQIRLHVHETLRASLAELAYIPVPEPVPVPDTTTTDTATVTVAADELRSLRLLRDSIAAGTVLPFDIRRRPRTTSLDPRPPWKSGPFKRA